MLWKRKRRLREHEEPERRSRELFGRIAQQVGLANNVVVQGPLSREAMPCGWFTVNTRGIVLP
jgi:hypothetical protein